MVHRDYIVRMIEQATQFIAQTIFKLKQENKLQEAQTVLDELYLRLNLPPASVIRSMSPDALVQLLSQNGELNLDKLATAAILLQEEAEIALTAQPPGISQHLFDKSLHLWLVYHQHDPVDLSETYIERLLSSLPSVELLDQTKPLYLRYALVKGRYAEAEDTLYRLPQNEALAETGFSFYHSLLEKTDTELANGGLPRHEVLEGLEQWRSKFNISP